MADAFKTKAKSKQKNVFDRDYLLAGGDYLSADPLRQEVSNFGELSDAAGGGTLGEVFGFGEERRRVAARDDIIPVPLEDDNRRRAQAQRRRARQSDTGYQSTLLTETLG